MASKCPWTAVVTFLFGLVAAVLGGWHDKTALAEVPANKGKPNILVIITDQQHAGMLSCAGNKWLKTPALDSLAKRGMRFELAYTTNPVCIPARVSLVTGYMPSRFGVRSNAEGKNQASEWVLKQTLGQLVRRAGYRTVYGGKTHWIRGMTVKTVGFEPLTPNSREGLAEKCEQFLRQKHDRPFLLVASFINPHDICYMAIDAYTQATGQPKMFSQSTVERQRLAEALKMPPGVTREEFFARLCPPLPENFEIPLLEPEAITTEYLDARPFRRWVRENWSEEDWRLHRWAYCRLTEVVDRHIGRVLHALRETGLDKNTVVFFTSDHGDLDSAHRLEHKSILYEEAARVPFIVSWPGVVPEGIVDREHFISVGLDLLPTICDFAGIKPPDDLPGRSLRPILEGRTPSSWREAVFVESKAGRMVRTKRFKYVVYETGKKREQLIDLANDPGEMKNLAQEPAYAEVLQEHRRLLRQWVEKVQDPFGVRYVPEP